MSETEFTMCQVDTAIKHVIDNGACNNGSAIHFSLVFAAGLAAPQELHQSGDSHLISLFMKALTWLKIAGSREPSRADLRVPAIRRRFAH